jgi:Mn-dependent DtxR family transcriptional regulator
MGDWTFFSNHGHVLVCLANNNEARLRDVAAEVGITERAAQKIVKDMQDAGYLTVTKHGRCNRYQINKRKSLRHDLESHCNVGKILSVLTGSQSARQTRLKNQPEPVVRLETGPRVQVPEEVTTRYPSGAKDLPAEKVANKAETKKEPIDTREQGSLF